MRGAGAKPVLNSDAASAHKTAAERWTELFGTKPPTRPEQLVEQAVAWQEQALLHGDVLPNIRRDLHIARSQALASRQKRLGAAAGPGQFLLPCVKPGPSVAGKDGVQFDAPRHKPELPTASSQLLPGTRLVKAHGGKTHVVEVTVDGMLYEGQLYSSLSAVAKAITGSHWNGLLFFGLRKRKPYERKKANG